MNTFENTVSKVCTKCGIEKPFSDFHKYKQGKFGLKANCKPCNNLKAKEWRIQNTDKANATKRAYRAKNKEKMSEYFAARYLKNKDKVYAANKKWRDNNPEKVKLMIEAYRKAYSDRHKLVQHKRRARKKESGGTLSRGLSARLFKLQNGLCPCCGLELGRNYHLDHIVPLALGGPNTDNNIQLLRAECNRLKNAKHPVDYMQSKGFLL